MFKSNQSVFSIRHILECWYVFIAGCNHIVLKVLKCHLNPSCPCKKTSDSLYKGISMAITHVVIHAHECTMFFQVFPWKSNVHCLEVPSKWKSSSSSSSSEYLGVLNDRSSVHWSGWSLWHISWCDRCWVK